MWLSAFLPSQSTVNTCSPPLAGEYRGDGDPHWMWLGNPLTPGRATAVSPLHLTPTEGRSTTMGSFSLCHNFLFLELGLRVLPLVKEVLRGTSNAVGCGDKIKGAKSAASPRRWCPISSLHLTPMQGSGGCRLPPGRRAEQGMRGGDSRIAEACLN